MPNPPLTPAERQHILDALDALPGAVSVVCFAVGRMVSKEWGREVTGFEVCVVNAERGRG